MWKQEGIWKEAIQLWELTAELGEPLLSYLRVDKKKKKRERNIQRKPCR